MRLYCLLIIGSLMIFSGGCKKQVEPKKINTPDSANAPVIPNKGPDSSSPIQPMPAPIITGPAGQNAADFELTFSEDFEGGVLNQAIWNDHIWYETSNATRNYRVTNGMLKIWPQRDVNGNFFNRTIDTDGKFYQTYGYFEMEAKLPYGKGTWPAFWLFDHPGNDRPEIDIMEAYAGGGPDSGWSSADFKPTAFAATIWPNGSANASAGHKVLQTADLSAAFHKYGLLWEPNKLTFYFDGKPFYSVDQTMNHRMYIILDLWFGSASGTPDQSTPTGELNSFEINYVKAWKKK